ncbi:MAG: hypothetical protein AAB415_01525 [Patescibacteria group bacterium]
MSKNIIKIVVFLGILIILVVAINFLSDSKKQNPNKQQDHQTVTSTTTSTPTVREFDASGLMDRQIRIDHVLNTKGKDYRRFSLTNGGQKDLIITYYQINLKNIQSDDVAIRRQQQGILVFKDRESGQIDLIWESKEHISDPRVKVGMYDVTGDKTNEILALWDNDQGEALYIYKWNGVGFNMISAYYDHKRPDGIISKELAFGGEESMTKIFDVDKDGIPEIVQPYNIILGLAENRLDVISKKVYQAYKWNGSEYYLWKEQKQSFTPREWEDEYSVINIL